MNFPSARLLAIGGDPIARAGSVGELETGPSVWYSFSDGVWYRNSEGARRVVSSGDLTEEDFRSQDWIAYSGAVSNGQPDFDGRIKSEGVPLFDIYDKKCEENINGE